MLREFIKTRANALSKIMAAIIFVILVIYYATTTINSNVMKTQMNTVGEHPYAVVVAIGDVKADLTLLRALPERLMFSQSDGIIKGVEEHYENIDTSMKSLIETLSDRYLADKTNVPLLEKTYTELQTSQTQLIEMVSKKTSSTEEITQFYNTYIILKLDSLDKIAEDINSGAGRKLKDYTSLVNESRDSMTLMATVLSISIIIAIVFYLYLLKLKLKAEEETNAVKSELMVEQRANSAKSQFLFNMSHDIRTPMNAIIGLTAIAAMNANKEDKVKECLTKISSSSKQLLGLINDVLDMSRIESGKVSLSEDAFVLPELISDLIGIFQPQAIEKNIRMEINVNKIEHEHVYADATRIKRILVNLVGNSLKFTPTGESIWLTIQELPPTTKGYGNYQFIVKDTGIGMTEEFLKKIFQPFERMETSTKSKVEGTGLGMAITKNIVDMMGGFIKVESELDKGTTFTVNIPIKLQGIEDELFDFTTLHDLYSLVIDDDELSCENTSRMIREIGMCSEWVLTGQEAIEKIKAGYDINRNYHVIIVDWQMPHMDGLQTTKEIRKIVGYDLPIIFLTAYDWIDIEEEAKEAGVNAFLTKPVFKSQLYHVMHNLTTNTINEDVVIDNEVTKQYLGHVLLVEDNEINMEIAKEFLEYFGIEAEDAWDGKEAVEKIKSSPVGYYSLVFMDIQMPQMDGYEATRQIRLFEKASNIESTPIVAMSANAFVEEINAGYESGMDGYITKPVDLSILNGVLEKYLKEK